MTTVCFQADDGHALQGRLHGDPQCARAGVLIAPAMGVPSQRYGAFAQWLADQGFAVFTFHYRGVGGSRPQSGSLRHLDADIVTWARHDAGAALAWLRAQLAAGTPIHWLGHSLWTQVCHWLQHAPSS